MEYIDYFEWILNSKFLQKGDDELTMIEEAQGDEKAQKVRIVSSSSSISKMRLYGFNALDKGTKDLFPFFNQRTRDPGKAPHGLTSFCDYILLVQHVKGLFVFFFEMKRGDNGDADKQIEASTMLFDYVRQSAERIKSVNSFPDFNPELVQYRRIIISEKCSNKRGTKDNDIEDFDMNDVIQHNCHDEFRPLKYCVRN
ncbi:MAG: hypothetical protein IKH44_09155 [Bacteroidales bacterium]|nr:hypothetical protein [Bacteroidales bacterium]